MRLLSIVMHRRTQHLADDDIIINPRPNRPQPGNRGELAALGLWGDIALQDVCDQSHLGGKILLLQLCRSRSRHSVIWDR